MKVYFQSEIVGISSPIDIFAEFGAGVLTGNITADHATASYGVPVLVYDGQAYGPWDLQPTPGGTSKLIASYDATVGEIVEARRVGFNVVLPSDSGRDN
jgi:hypothetical protein